MKHAAPGKGSPAIKPALLACARPVRMGRLWWNAVFVLLLAVALIGLGGFLFAPEWTVLAGDLPVGMRSPLMANYSADLSQGTLAPVNLSIIGEALADRPVPDGLVPMAQLATIMDDLRTLVPTVTPRPTATPTNQTGMRLTPLSSSAVPTATGITVGTASATAASTRTLDASGTPAPSATRLPSSTATFVPPTATHPAIVPAATRTATLFLPSPTYGTIKTPLPTRTAKSTQVPPTAIPVLPTRTPQPPVNTPESPYPPPPPPPPPPEETLPSYP